MRGGNPLRMPLFWAGTLFALLVLFMPVFAPVFAWLFPGMTPIIYPRESFLSLWLSHAGFVAISALISTAIGVTVGVFVTREVGREFRAIVNATAVVGQTFPPAAVLALAVPAVGFGALPTLIALAIYGLLPIVENTIAGIDAVPRDVVEAGRGVGLSPRQLLARVELPLAAPYLLAGIRTSVVIGIGTATIGSTVGALTLGAPIMSGLFSGRLPWVIQGALVAGMFAIVTDMMFDLLIKRIGRR